jgi:predicted ATPase
MEAKMHHIKISNFGPIEECDMDINQFTVLTGPQASGKSTIAKAIYFFRTIKDDILNLIVNEPTACANALKRGLAAKAVSQVE